MKNAIILHGSTDAKEYYSPDYPSLSNSHWSPWLQKQLLIHKIEVHTPEVFEAYKPTYDKWLRELSRYKIGEQTILVGHSCGAGFIIRWLSENRRARVAKVILVAPWLNTDNVRKTDMFNFRLDPNFAERTRKAVVFYSSNDMPTIKKTVKKLQAETAGIEFREFKNYGHFCYEDMETDKFPELLQECLKGS